MKPESMSDERFEDPAGWTADELLDVICEDDGTDISQVSDEALRGAIPVAQTRGLAIPLGALEHESGRRAVLRGLAAPEHPEPLPPVQPPQHEYPANAEVALARPKGYGPVVYVDTVMLPAEISLQQAVEIEAILQAKGEASLDAAAGSIYFEMHCDDLWDACSVAYEISGELAEHGVECEVDRDKLVDRKPTEPEATAAE